MAGLGQFLGGGSGEWDSSRRGVGQNWDWGREFRSGDVNYIALIHVALLRVFEARASVRFPRVVGEGGLDGWYFYLDAVEGLYALLLPELRRGVRGFIEAARAEAAIEAFRSYSDASDAVEFVEHAVKVIGKAAAEAGVRMRYVEALKHWLPEDLLYIAVSRYSMLVDRIVYWLDRAVERIVENLKEAGLLLPSRIVKVGGVARR